MTFSRSRAKRFSQTRHAFLGLLAFTVSGLNPALAQGEDEVFKYLIPLAEAVNSSESGLNHNVISKTTKLLTELEVRKRASGTIARRPLPLLRGDTSCGDVYRQLEAETLALRGQSNFALKRIPQAIADLKQASSLCPEHAHILSELGTVYVKTKKTKEGISLLTRAITLNFNIAEAYSMRAKAYRQIGKLKDARSDQVRSQKLSSDQLKTIDSLTEKIDKLVQENRLAEAIDLNRQLLQTAPRDGLVITGYADRLTSIEKYKDALSFASTSIALDPSIGYSYRIRSVINSRLQRPDLELRDANIAFNLEPRSAEALNSRAIANLDADQPIQAIRDFNLLIKRTPEFADAYINRSTAYLRIGEFEKAIKDATHAITLAPTSPYGYQCLGAASRRGGKLKEAREALDLSLRYNKKANADSIAMAQFNLGAVLLSLNDPSGLDHIDSAIKLAPNLSELFLQRGAYNASLGEIDDAIKILTRSPSRKTNSPYITKLVRPSSIKKKSIAVAKTGSNSGLTSVKKSPPPPPHALRKIKVSTLDLKDCILVANREIEITPNKAEAYYARGLAFLCLKQYDNALKDFRKLADVSKTGNLHENALLLAFLCLERMGNSSEAKQLIDRSKLPESKFLRGEITETLLLSGKFSTKDLTRIHSYLGFHYNSIEEAKADTNTHVRWVLEQGDVSSPELVLTAADSIPQPQ